MMLKFNDFIVKIDSRIIELDEKIIAPIELDKYNHKPKMGWKNKTKEITIFGSLLFLENKDKKYYQVISDIFVFIDLIEVLKGYGGKRLEPKKEYNFSDKFTAKTVQKNGETFLKIHFKNYSNSLYLDKFECSSLAAKFSKILQRCEVWQELEA